jgi:hypothetical protein
LNGEDVNSFDENELEAAFDEFNEEEFLIQDNI